MGRKKKVIILQIDGLGYKDALDAIHNGHMPFLRKLLTEKEYEILKYRSGIPSTTPYVQAGILYGDNSEIPCFRWFDRTKKKTIQALADRNFYDVKDKFFKKGKPLLKKGAAIASIYAGGSKAAFAVSYVERGGRTQFTNALTKDIALHLFLNPIQNMKWHWHTFKKSLKIGYEVLRNIVKRKYIDWIHFPFYLMDQFFLFYPTSIAIKKAIKSNFPVTYAGFYTYDTVAHLFGEKSSHGNGILKDIDNAVKSISNTVKKDECELIILSDHGETKFEFIGKVTGKTLAEHVSEILPQFEIVEHPGKNIKPSTVQLGKIVLAYAGGLAHFYDASSKKRLHYKDVSKRFPGLIQKLVRLKEIAAIVVKDGKHTMLITERKVFALDKKLGIIAKQYLRRFDHPEIVAKQLAELNKHENSGDIILIAEQYKDYQISFEAPVSGHGSIGGGQSHPFILLKKNHNLDTSKITDARDLNPFLHSLVASS